MTIGKANIASYESHPFFNKDEAALNPKVRIVSIPKLVNTKDYGEKLFLTIEITKKPSYKDLDDDEMTKREEDSTRTWSLNDTTRNHLIDSLGGDENLWIGKDLDVIVIKNPVKGAKNKVITVKGAFKENA